MTIPGEQWRYSAVRVHSPKLPSHPGWIRGPLAGPSAWLRSLLKPSYRADPLHCGVTCERIPTCFCKASRAACVQMEKDLAKGGRVQRSEKAPRICSEGSRSCPLCRLTSRALVRPHSLCPALNCPLTVTSAPVSGLTQASDGPRCFQSPLPLAEASSAVADALCN